MSDVQSGVVAIVSGFVVFVIGMALSGTVASSAVTANTSLDAYPAAQGMNNLLPLIFEIGLMVGGIGLMIFGGLKVAGKV